MDSRITDLLDARDEQAIEQIKHEYGKLCHTVAFQILGSHEDAEECVNDMLLAVWNSKTPVRAETLRAFLVSLVRRTALDRLRTQTRQKRGGTQFALALDEIADIIPSGEDVEQQTDRRVLSEALNDFLRALPQDTMRIFMQRYYLSMSVAEIAEKNNMGTSAVKMSLMRTRNKLKACLRKEGLI